MCKRSCSVPHVDPDWYDKNFGSYKKEHGIEHKNCIQKFWPESVVSEVVIQALDDLKHDEVIFEVLRKDICDETLMTNKSAKDELKVLRRKESELISKKDSLIKAELLGKVTEDKKESYDRLIEKIDEDIKSIRDEIEEKENEKEENLERGLATLEAADSFTKLYEIKFDALASSTEKTDERFETKVEISNLRRMLEQIFRTLYAGKPLVKGKTIEDYEDIEVFYNEPFDLLYEIKELELLPNGRGGSGSKPQTKYARRDLNPRPSDS